ncbi:TetR family transcriptional regulator [Kitasatospora sp. SolWspMP-SS2h]|uniref:ScbR family autoregulator-binding transcription factor n=1 Tax=Kitasatospora sp. SolWspMP-SS2h TaxID=1305729 RepID=UPI000DBA75AD|nr:ScbR family autoregulator-binding transcription factor [Kitasatospora sp. SolWspMP-SS2h]RAJ39639.1 TetR family transcriptional regulator [Kitasatospora sp. SolWspMP-SS2h]
MLKQERALQTRRTVLDAAARVFAVNGYLGTSLAQILAEAGVTKGALYFHFSSKEELARAVVDEQFAPAADGEAAPLPEGPALQAAIDLSHGIGRSLREDPMMQASIRLVIEQAFTEPDPGPYLRWIEVIEQLLTEAHRVGDLRATVVPADLARFVISSFTGIQLVSGVLDHRTELSRRVGDMWELILPTVVPPRRLHKFRARPETPADADTGAADADTA